ncbi:hypothetical protein B0H14DRAFT_3781939 [Mycena olivaceomarginata]|nr:hypothetical protein B0H14DRAFT_3781939 [Mycena olivaceomarginata]
MREIKAPGVYLDPDLKGKPMGKKISVRGALPMNRMAINYGVEVYIDYGPAKDFFARFDVPTQPVVQFAANTIYADAATGTLLPNITVPPVADQLAALQTYLTAVEQYTPYLLPGY